MSGAAGRKGFRPSPCWCLLEGAGIHPTDSRVLLPLSISNFSTCPFITWLLTSAVVSVCLWIPIPLTLRAQLHLEALCLRVKSFCCSPRWTLVHMRQGHQTSRQNTPEAHRHPWDSIRPKVVTFPLSFNPYSNDICLNYYWRHKAEAMFKGFISANIWRAINTEPYS